MIVAGDIVEYKGKEYIVLSKEEVALRLGRTALDFVPPNSVWAYFRGDHQSPFYTESYNVKLVKKTRKLRRTLPDWF
jgi:hypothetical protein